MTRPKRVGGVIRLSQGIRGSDVSILPTLRWPDEFVGTARQLAKVWVVVREQGGKFPATKGPGNAREIVNGVLTVATWLGRPGLAARWSENVQVLDQGVTGILLGLTSLHRVADVRSSMKCAFSVRTIKGLAHDATGQMSNRQRRSNMSQRYWRKWEWEVDAHDELGSPSFMLDNQEVMNLSWVPKPGGRSTYGLVMPNLQVVPVFRLPLRMTQPDPVEQRVWTRWDAMPGTIMRMERCRQWHGIQWWSADRYWVAGQPSTACPWTEDQLTWSEVMPGVLLESLPVMEPDVLYRAQLD